MFGTIPRLIGMFHAAESRSSVSLQQGKNRRTSVLPAQRVLYPDTPKGSTVKGSLTMDAVKVPLPATPDSMLQSEASHSDVFQSAHQSFR